jgi:hypothetical protein
MAPRAPLRVVDNPRFSEPVLFRAALYRAARHMAGCPMTAADLTLIHAARLLVDQAHHNTTGAERRELANAEFRLAVVLLRDARRQDATRAMRLRKNMVADLPWREGEGE